MRILYVGHTRFPTEKAHGKQIAEVCSAMALLGHEVTLVTPTVHTPIDETPFAYYGVPEIFTWRQLKSFDALHNFLVPQSIAFMLGMWSYRRALRRSLKKYTFDLLYCRSQAVLSVLLHSKMPTMIELHTLPKAVRKDFIKDCNRCLRVVCLTAPMREELIFFGVDPHRMILEGDAVRSDVLADRKALSEEKPKLSRTRVIGYVGSFVARNTLEKGVNVLLVAISILHKKDMNVQCLIAGGPKSWQKKYEKLAEKLDISSIISFMGHVPALKVPILLSQCDILVYPAPASNHPYFLRDTSPLKIFEYMASGKPIVAADLPPIRDILDETCTAFSTPGDAEDLARALEYVIADPVAALKRALTARKRVEEHTWEKRMQRILLGIGEGMPQNPMHG